MVGITLVCRGMKPSDGPGHPRVLYIEGQSNPKIIVERKLWVGSVGHTIKEFQRS